MIIIISVLEMRLLMLKEARFLFSSIIYRKDRLDCMAVTTNPQTLRTSSNKSLIYCYAKCGPKGAQGDLLCIATVLALGPRLTGQL